MLGVNMTDDDRTYYARMDELIAALPEARQQALIEVIKAVLRAFTEDDTRGVLLIMDDKNYLHTMGINASWYEAAELVDASHYIFQQTRDSADSEVKH